MTEQPIKFQCSFMEHKDGSKFYRVMYFENPSAETFVLVKQWGKMALAKTGGGQCKVEVFGLQSSAISEYYTTVRSKQARGYHAPVGTGFPSVSYSNTSIDPKEFGRFLNGKVGNPGAVFEPVMRRSAHAFETLPVIKREELVDRGDTWGSW